MLVAVVTCRKENKLDGIYILFLLVLHSCIPFLITNNITKQTSQCLGQISLKFIAGKARFESLLWGIFFAAIFLLQQYFETAPNIHAKNNGIYLNIQIYARELKTIAWRVFRPNEWCSIARHGYQWLHTLLSKGKLARAIDCEFTLKSVFQSFLASTIGKPNRVAITCSWHLIDWGGYGSFMDQSERWKNRCNLGFQ